MSTVVTLPPMSLTLVAVNNTQTVLDSNAIGNLSSYQAMGGYRKKTGAVVGPDAYEGPTLNTLCALVGGLSSDNALRITSLDGYSQIFTYEQINGQFVTYNSSGKVVPHSQPLYPLIAYHKNGLNISSSEGPLRVAIVGPESLFTDSQYWSKQVIKLEIRWRHDVAVVSVIPARAIARQGSFCDVNVYIENQGGYDEAFDCKLYANSTLVATTGVSLPSWTATTVASAWNTTGWQLGHYALSAAVDTVMEETDTADNSLTENFIIVAHIGDVNGDNRVDIQDVAMESAAFGSFPLHPRWNPNCDMNGDNRIDVGDVARTCGNFGWHL